MASSQPVPISGDLDRSGVMGSIRSMARRLSGTFIGSGGRAGNAVVQGRGKPPIFVHEQENENSPHTLLKISGVFAQELANNFGTPLFVFDAARLVDNYQTHYSVLARGFPAGNFTLLYSLKANPSLGIADVFKTLGSGFLAVSAGEVARLQQLSVPMETHVIFGGPGKSRTDIEAALEANVGCFNIESWAELELVEEVARQLNTVANVAIRVNPELRLTPSELDPTIQNIDQRFKFGVAISEVVQMSVRAKASAFLKVKGLAVHLVIASGTNLDPWIEARDKLLAIADTLRNESRIWIEHVSLGGTGFTLPFGLSGAELTAWVERLTKPISERGLRLYLDPGKGLVSDAGLLLTRILNLKRVILPLAGSGTSSPRRGSLAGAPQSPLSTSPPPVGSPLPGMEKVEKGATLVRSFVTVDTGLSEFSRQSPGGQPPRIVAGHSSGVLLPVDVRYDIVGPLDDLSDLFARDYNIGEELKPGNLLAIADAGAYCESLSAASYCSRPRPAQVLISGRSVHLIREREQRDTQFRLEKVAPSTVKLASGTADVAEDEAGEQEQDSN